MKLKLVSITRDLALKGYVKVVFAAEVQEALDVCLELLDATITSSDLQPVGLPVELYAHQRGHLDSLTAAAGLESLPPMRQGLLAEPAA